VVTVVVVGEGVEVVGDGARWSEVGQGVVVVVVGEGSCKGTSVHSLTSPVSNYVYMYSPQSPYISDHIYTTLTSSR
jgi:hypothetical protein